MRTADCNDNLSLFDDIDNKQGSSGHKLDVIKLTYDHAEAMTWKELFSGFDSLFAITYSSGIGFMYQLLEMFENAQIIFGCENIMSYTLQEIMAFQNKVIDRMRDKIASKREQLISRIEDQSVHFYVARAQLSHEKIYLLSNRDGRKRVIMGSANMSFNAFSGIQRENICFLDDEKAYDWYYDIFEGLKENCTDEITKQAFVSSDLNDHIDELPVAGTVKVSKALVIEPD